MREILFVLFRTSIVLILIFILFKLMGKKQASQITSFDYITGITIGSIVADISLDIEKSIIAGIICLTVYSFVNIIFSYLSIKSVYIRKFLNGKTVVLIENGNILSENLSKNKITIDILETEARLQGYFNLDEINNAILETNGKISFEPKNKNKPLTQQDIGLKNKDMGLVYNLIIDGLIIDENLKITNKSKKWLLQQIKIQGVLLENILLLTIDSQDKIKIYKK